jgi:hypothetical protein
MLQHGTAWYSMTIPVDNHGEGVPLKSAETEIRSSGERTKFTHTRHIAFPSLAEHTVYKSIDPPHLHPHTHLIKHATSPSP